MINNQICELFLFYDATYVDFLCLQIKYQILRSARTLVSLNKLNNHSTCLCLQIHQILLRRGWSGEEDFAAKANILLAFSKAVGAV